MKVKAAPDIAKRVLKTGEDHKIEISLSQPGGNLIVVAMIEDPEDVAAIGMSLEEADQLVVNLQQILIKARTHLMRQT